MTFIRCAPAHREPSRVVVVYSGDQAFQPERVCAECVAYDITRPPPDGLEAQIIVLVGHSSPPEHVVGRPPSEVFARLAHIQPTPALLILDTCFGASNDMIEAMVDAGLRPDTVLAYAGRVPLDGFTYAANLFADSVDPAAVADSVSCCADRDRTLTRLTGDYDIAIARRAADIRDEARRCASEIQFHSIMPNRIRTNDTSATGGPIEGPFLFEVLPEDWCPGQCAPFVVQEAGT